MVKILLITSYVRTAGDFNDLFYDKTQTKHRVARVRVGKQCHFTDSIFELQNVASRLAASLLLLVETFVDLRSNLILIKVSASQRKCI